MTNIVATSVSFSKNKTLQKKFLKYFPNAKLNTQGVRFNEDTLIDFIKDAQGIIVGLEPITKKVLDNSPKLKYISKYGVGLNNIDLKECKKRNIKVISTQGVNRLSVAEMTLGFMLMLSRNLYTTSNLLKQGIWQKNGGFELSGKIIGIIGVGHIGKELIRLLKPFRCKIFVNDIIRQKKYYKKIILLKPQKKRYIKNAI